MALQQQIFNEFTPSMFAAFSAKIEKDTGVKITSDEGTVTHGSFVFTYDYDPTNNVLLVQCTKKPLFIPASTIINGLNEEVLELKAGVLNGSIVATPKVTEPAPETTA